MPFDSKALTISIFSGYLWILLVDHCRAQWLTKGFWYTPLVCDHRTRDITKAVGNQTDFVVSFDTPEEISENPKICIKAAIHSEIFLKPKKSIASMSKSKVFGQNYLLNVSIWHSLSAKVGSSAVRTEQCSMNKLSYPPDCGDRRNVSVKRLLISIVFWEENFVRKPQYPLWYIGVILVYRLIFSRDSL